MCISLGSTVQLQLQWRNFVNHLQHTAYQIRWCHNGPAFISQEFEEFLIQNGVHHIRTAAYHPASNGLAERSVQTFKNGMKRLQGGTLHTRLAQFLFSYRTTPHTTTGVSPAELLMGRRLMTRLDRLYCTQMLAVECRHNNYDKRTIMTNTPYSVVSESRIWYL